MTTATVFHTRNTDYGFFGTLTTCPERDRRTSEVWSLASRLIAQAVNATSEEEMIGIRDFLDSRSGRHFADEFVGALQCGAPDCETAIAAAIAKWQDRRITRAKERSDGIPAGLPYLTGWVQHFAVTATMEERH
jgi:hypothetical protein